MARLYHDTVPNAIQQRLCRRCGPSDCSTKQWSPQRHPEPPWWHEGVASGWKWPQILHKTPDQLIYNTVKTEWTISWCFISPAVLQQAPSNKESSGSLYKCKDSTRFLICCLKHSGSKYFCTNFSIRGALRGFNSLGFITLKDGIRSAGATGKSLALLEARR